MTQLVGTETGSVAGKAGDARPEVAAASGGRGGAREQSRARYPDREGYVERDGVRIFYEV